MMKNKHRATGLLGLAACGFIIAFYFHTNFIGGLLTAGFGAALIGGLADWFAVAALFRRPLGIPYRTAIIPRNREKIFQALATMVEQELLMKENVKRRINEYDMAGRLLTLLSGAEGRNILKRILYGLMRDMLTNFNEEEINILIDNMVKSAVANTNLAPYLLSGTERLLRQGYDKKILDIILDWLIRVAGSKKIVIWLSRLVHSALQQYEKGKNRRAVFDMLIAIDPMEAASLGQKQLIVALKNLQQPKSILRQKLCRQLLVWVIERGQDKAFLNTVQLWLGGCMQHLQIGARIAPYLADMAGQAAKSTRKSARWLEILLQEIDRRVEYVMENEAAKASLDRYLKRLLEDLVDRRHDEIGRMVLDSLRAFSNDMLVEFVERKVGDDLQMIRINGSIVGGLVGMVLYLSTFWI